MSDVRIQRLQRTWRASGAVEDAAAYLRERVRAGDALDWEEYTLLHAGDQLAAARYLEGQVARGELNPERLELARRLGHLEPEAGSGLDGSLALLVAQCGPGWLIHVCLPHMATYARSLPRGDAKVYAWDLVAAAREVVEAESMGACETWQHGRLYFGESPPYLWIQQRFATVLALADHRRHQLSPPDPIHLSALELLERLGVKTLAGEDDAPERQLLLRRVLSDPRLPTPWPAHGELELFSF